MFLVTTNLAGFWLVICPTVNWSKLILIGQTTDQLKPRTELFGFTNLLRGEAEHVLPEVGPQRRWFSLKWSQLFSLSK